MPEYSYFRAEGQLLGTVTAFVNAEAKAEEFKQILRTFHHAADIRLLGKYGEEGVAFVYPAGAEIHKGLDIFSVERGADGKEKHVLATIKSGTRDARRVEEFLSLLRNQISIASGALAQLPFTKLERIGGAWYVHVPNDFDGRPLFTPSGGVLVSEAEIERLRQGGQNPPPPAPRNPMGPKGF